MVSQVLFGECVEILGAKDEWLLIESAWDSSQGWVHQAHLISLTPSEYDAYQDNYSISLSLAEPLQTEDSFMPVTLGATLPQFDGLRGKLAEFSYRFGGTVVTPSKQPLPDYWMERIIRRYLHAPHLHGGRSPFGIDSAALVQMVYRMAGIKLLRYPYQQVTQGRGVDFMEQCQTGDLAFFDDGKGNISHVGIILKDCYIAHVHGQVRLDKIDHFGIFSTKSNKYSHQLRVIRRLLPNAILGTETIEVGEISEVQPESTATSYGLFD
jgi:hypothetical protein